MNGLYIVLAAAMMFVVFMILTVEPFASAGAIRTLLIIGFVAVALVATLEWLLAKNLTGRSTSEQRQNDYQRQLDEIDER
jgi:NADH:ubiquinone oxidoreductase subunit 3 (subunit A)